MKTITYLALILSAVQLLAVRVIVEPGSDVVLQAASDHHQHWHSSKEPVATVSKISGSLVVRAKNSLLHKHASVVLNLSEPLTFLAVEGDSNVILDHAKTENLQIMSYGSGTISLKGDIQLAKILHTGTGNIRGVWINSDKLKINSKYGQIELAGVCKDLKINGERDAIINTQYLRSKNVWVKASDYASISILPTKHMKVWATDYSQVFYRNMLGFFDRDTDSFDNALIMHVSK